MVRTRLAALLAAVLVGASAGSASADPIPADIVFVFDTSGSMQDDINEVRNRILQFNTALTNAGIDPRYALVRFGGTESLAQQLTTFAAFTAPGSPFSTLTASGGGTERGSQATNVALAQVAFRPDSVRNFVLITDEDDDSTQAQFDLARAGVPAADVLYNAIGVPGVGNTNARYGVLAAENGGVLFSINDFRSNPGPFFDNFINVKVAEIQQQAGAVPEPASLAVLGVAAVGALGWHRRRRAAG